MKEKLLLPAMIGVLFADLLVSGCGTVSLDKGVFDPGVPEDQQCFLQVQNNIAVHQFDEDFVNWKPEGFAWTNNFTAVTIPAGTHTFNFTWTYTQNDGYGFIRTITNKGTLQNQELKAGHTYKLYQQRIWVIFFIITNIKLKDITPRKVLAELGA